MTTVVVRVMISITFTTAFLLLCQCRLLEKYLFESLHVTVTEEGAKEAAVQVIKHHHQEVFVELKRIRKLQHNKSLCVLLNGQMHCIQRATFL